MSKIEFANYIKELRLKNGLTTKTVEEITGISNSYISMLENGKREIPSPAILKKLAKIYKESYNEIMVKAGFINTVYEIPVKELPEEMRYIESEYLLFAREMQDKNISLDKLRKILDLFD